MPIQGEHDELRPSNFSRLQTVSARDLLDLVGNTPLVRLSRLDTGPCALFAKLESQNPGGSIKDRIAVSMIEAAERQGALSPGGTIVEATAGNTGLALALVGSLKGYRTLLVVPDKMSREKIQHLKALGAEVVMTRSDVGKGHPAYYQDLAQRLASEREGAWYANQFANPANPAAHERTTGPEIWAQMDHRVDAVVCGVGSGGTITGLTHYFRGIGAPVKMILADPVGSVLAEYTRSGGVGSAGSWQVEGIGEDFVPPIADLSSKRGLQHRRQGELRRRLASCFASKASSRVARRERCWLRRLALLSQPHGARARGHVRCDTGAKDLPRCTMISGWRPGPPRPRTRATLPTSSPAASPRCPWSRPRRRHAADCARDCSKLYRVSQLPVRR
jgi:cysteine synthase